MDSEMPDKRDSWAKFRERLRVEAKTHNAIIYERALFMLDTYAAEGRAELEHLNATLVATIGNAERHYAVHREELARLRQSEQRLREALEAARPWVASHAALTCRDDDFDPRDRIALDKIDTALAGEDGGNDE